MKCYVALLRGINVSGKNKVDMKVLKRVFTDLGFLKVTTYINSGNVVFLSDITDISKLRALCEKTIEETFGVLIKVLVMSLDDLELGLLSAPDWWGELPNAIDYAIFLIPPITIREVLESVGTIKDAYEKIAYTDHMIFWSTTREFFSKSRWGKIASSTVNSHVTIRNKNTILKIFSMMKEIL